MRLSAISVFVHTDCHFKITKNDTFVFHLHSVHGFAQHLVFLGTEARYREMFCFWGVFYRSTKKTTVSDGKGRLDASLLHSDFTTSLFMGRLYAIVLIQDFLHYYCLLELHFAKRLAGTLGLLASNCRGDTKEIVRDEEKERKQGTKTDCTYPTFD